MKPIDKRILAQSPIPLYQESQFQIIVGVSLVAFMGIPSITPAFPKIVQDLDISPQMVGLLITAFTLPNVLLGPILGVLADRVGRKLILVTSLIVFSLAGMSCAAAADFYFLLAMRCLQGAGAASLVFLSVTLIGDFYSGQQRTTAMGYQASAISFGTALYPLLGGVLAIWGWNYPFLLAGLGIPVGIWVWTSLPLAKPKAQQSLTAYVRQALGHIRGRQFIGLFASTITTFILLCGTCATYFPILIQRQFDTSPLIVGLFLSILFATVTLTASQFNRLVKHYPQVRLIQWSFLLYAIALVVMPLLHDLRSLLVPVVIYGVALGIGLPSIQNLLAELTPPDCRAAVMSLNGAVLGLGQAFGPILLGLAYGVWNLGGVFFTGSAIALGMFSLLRICLHCELGAIANSSERRTTL